MEALKVWALWLWSQWQTQFLVGHIMVNLIVAVAASIYSGTFVLVKVPEFLYKKVLPYTMIYGAFSFFGQTINMDAVATGVWGLISMALVGDLLDSLALVGVKLPDGLTKARLQP